MKIFNSFNISKSFRDCVLAIGNFDGVHKGHQKVFHQASQKAKKNRIKFGILTFEPMPTMFFNKKLKNFRLVSKENKMSLLKKFNADFVINAKFNKKFSKIYPDDFINKTIFKKINPRFIFVSDNFRFGHKRKGNIFHLRKYSSKCKYELKKTYPLKHKGKIISSTLIRQSLQHANINLANNLLTRTWFIDGTVQKGKKIGKKLGYPTCNINIKNYLIPKKGVYLVKIRLNKKKKIMTGIANLGYRPTFDGKKLVLEVNIFNFTRNLYKKKIRIYFLRFIREEKKFKNSDKLIKQINKDVILAKKYLTKKVIL